MLPLYDPAQLCYKTFIKDKTTFLNRIIIVSFHKNYFYTTISSLCKTLNIYKFIIYRENQALKAKPNTM